jgi:hypothetical protein
MRAAVRAMMEAHWSAHGYTVPHPARYPHQWLWDSCFHAVIWAELGDDRAVTELASVFRHQAPSGFVPHLTYDGGHEPHAGLWGRPRTSSITQPPLYGHAVAVLARRGLDIPAEVVERAQRGLGFLLHGRPRLDGLVTIVHPWESGADDSPRWDDWCGGAWDARSWRRRKGELVRSIEHAADGSPVANRPFTVASAGFNALVAFSATELAGAIGDGDLRREADAVAEALESCWDPQRATWVDRASGGGGSGAVRTIDALLGHLVSDRPFGAELFSADGYGTGHGPAGVHVEEPSYDPGAYWRGSSWPQLTYLLALAAGRRGDAAAEASLRGSLRRGAATSGLAEHWHARTGAPLGAVPQSWTGLAIVG